MKFSNIGRIMVFIILGAVIGAQIVVWDLYLSESPAIETVENKDTLEGTYTTEEAIGYIRNGAAILEMALDAFKEKPSYDLGRTLLGIADDFNIILGGLCTVPGTEDQCALATVLIVDAYETLIAFLKEQGEQE